jgi:hypothetical protein
MTLLPISYVNSCSYLQQNVVAYENKEWKKAKALENLVLVGMIAVKNYCNFEANMMSIVRAKGQKYLQKHISFYIQRDILRLENKAVAGDRKARRKAEKLVDQMKKARWTELSTDQGTIHVAQKVLKMLLLKRLILPD